MKNITSVKLNRLKGPVAQFFNNICNKSYKLLY